MGRRKKSEIEAENAPQSDLLVCPICGKEFKPTEDTYCWVREGLYEYKQVCSWACFKKRVDETPANYSVTGKTKPTKKNAVKIDFSKTEEITEPKTENLHEEETETEEEEIENAEVYE